VAITIWTWDYSPQWPNCCRARESWYSPTY